MSRIGGGEEREAIQAFISFGLGVSPLNPLTLRETRDKGFSSIIESTPGGLDAERSRFSDVYSCRA
jgi:hypothetical protein